MTKSKPNLRDLRAQERREAIIEAAFHEFNAKGFADTKVEDVARRAGVAKGTVYLHFADKEALFEGMARAILTPSMNAMNAVMAEVHPADTEAFERIFIPLAASLASSRTGDVHRLLTSEGLRFPKMAEFYYREFLEPVLTWQRANLKAAAAQGHLPPALADYPQLLMAPVMMSIVWHGLFERFEPLDVAAMLRVHHQSLMAPRK